MQQQDWQPAILAAKLDKLKLRAKLIRAVRNFFWTKDFLEVETPILQTSPGAEVHTHAFSTLLQGAFGEGKRELYLNSSPELAMKKLLVGGLPKIFQITKAFRNQEFSPLHQPEFTMLEWYRTGASYEDIMQDCEDLIKESAAACNINKIECNGRKSNPFAPWQRLSVAEAFFTYCGIDIAACLENSEKFAAGAKRIGINSEKDDSWDDIFFRIFLEKIEPHLGVGIPTILHDYPLSMAALSRAKPTDSRWAERFELYICGVELANAFGELTDPRIQARRFQEDQTKRQELYGQSHPIDQDFLAALEYGMPESAGIALGIDRLAMLFANANNLNEVLWLPIGGECC